MIELSRYYKHQLIKLTKSVCGNIVLYNVHDHIIVLSSKLLREIKRSFYLLKFKAQNKN
jgi:patatin-like phospholipase/acyl hydrolase